MMVGLGAPLAGWLADRWGETRVMITLFFGLGAASVLCGLASSPLTMQIALSVLGAFGAIYHPVGNSWVVHHASEPGKAIATAGIAGSSGVAGGPIVAGVLTDLIDWRTAFIIPGLVTAAFGLALAWVYAQGKVSDSRDAKREPTSLSFGSFELRLVLVLLAITMTLTLIVTTAFITALPKFIEHATKWDAHDLMAIGFAVGAIQLAGSFSQFIGGHVGDRGALRFSYSVSFVVLAVALLAAALTSGWLLLIVAIAVIAIMELIAPLETLLVARLAPPSRRGLFFGFRYALSIVGAPAGVALVAMLYDPASGFTTLMLGLSGLTVVTFLATLFLPRDRTSPAPENRAKPRPATAFHADSHKTTPAE
jgi:MFS family permease